MNERPNIIVILTDDLGYGDVSCMNPDGKIHTGNIDRLAAEGLILTDCHSSSALCTPSRYALLTGRYNWRSRLKSTVLPGQSFHLIEPGRETIPSLLKKQGYRTAAVGKWHLGMDWQIKGTYRQPASYFEGDNSPEGMLNGIDYTAPVKNGPNDIGFDYFYGMPASLDQPPFIHMENDRAVTRPEEMIGVRNLHRYDPSQQFDVEYGPAEKNFDPRAIVPEMDAKVLDLVRQYAGQAAPFFLYYACPAVHGPLVPTKEYQGKSGLNAYADFVLQVDGFVGQLDALLADTGIRDNTILIFTSDNGCSAVADFPTLISKGHNPSANYRGWKGNIWEGGHRIPFAVRWPGHIAPGTRSDATACLVDLFATFAQVTGASYGDDAGEDSFSMLPLWLGESDKVRDSLVHHSGAGFYSLRRGPWKMEFCAGAGERGDHTDQHGRPTYQLYLLGADSGEHWNLYGTCPDVEEALLSEMERCVRQGRSTPGAPQPNTPCPFWPGLGFLRQDDGHDAGQP